MLLKYFNSNRISLIGFITLFPILYWIPSLFQAGNIHIAEISAVPLGRLVIAFNRDFRILASLLALILIIVNGYLLIQLNTNHIFIPGRSQLPSFFYLVLVINITGLHQLTSQLIVSSLMILVFFRILSTYKTERISLHFLDAGLLISLASLFFLPAIAFFLFLLAALILLRPFIWREWTYAVLGLIIPYLFLASVYYLTGMPLSDYFKDVSASLHRTEQNFMVRQIVNWSYIGVLLIIGSVYMVGAIDNMKIHARKFFMVFLMFFLVSVIIYLLIPGSGTGMIYFASVPLAYLFSHYFARCKRNWVNEILFLICMLLLLWQRI